MTTKKVPQKVQTAAILQIVSGVLNIFFMTWMAYFVLALGLGTAGAIVTAVCTLGMCPFGALCGFAGLAAFLLVPVGFLEIIDGVMLLMGNDTARTFHRITSVVQKVSILFGGLGSLVISFVADAMLADPESLAFLEGHDEVF